MNSTEQRTQIKHAGKEKRERERESESERERREREDR